VQINTVLLNNNSGSAHNIEEVSRATSRVNSAHQQVAGQYNIYEFAGPADTHNDACANNYNKPALNEREVQLQFTEHQFYSHSTAVIEYIDGRENLTIGSLRE